MQRRWNIGKQWMKPSHEELNITNDDEELNITNDTKKLKITNHERGIDITGKANSVPRVISIDINDIFNNVKNIDVIEGQSIDGYGTDDIFIVIDNEHRLPAHYIKKYVLKDINPDRQITCNDTHYMLQNKFPDTFSYILYISKQLFVYDEVIELSNQLIKHKEELKRMKRLSHTINNNNLVIESTIKSLGEDIRQKVKENKELVDELDSVKKITIPIHPSNHINNILMMISDRFPHLSLQQCLDLTNKAISNGGKLKVHCGEYKEVDVDNYVGIPPTNYHQNKKPSTKQYSSKYYIWSCCPTITMKIDYAQTNNDVLNPWYKPSIEFGLSNCTYLTLSCKFGVEGLISTDRNLNYHIYLISGLDLDLDSVTANPFLYKHIINLLKQKDTSIELPISCATNQGHKLVSIIKTNTNNITDKQFNEYVHHYGSCDPASPCLNPEILDLSDITERIYESSREKELIGIQNKLTEQVTDLSIQIDNLTVHNDKLIKIARKGMEQQLASYVKGFKINQ